MASVLKNDELEAFRKTLLGLRSRLRGDLDQMTDEALRRDQPLLQQVRGAIDEIEIAGAMPDHAGRNGRPQYRHVTSPIAARSAVGRREVRPSDASAAEVDRREGRQGPEEALQLREEGRAGPEEARQWEDRREVHQPACREEVRLRREGRLIWEVRREVHRDAEARRVQRREVREEATAAAVGRQSTPAAT